MRQLLMDFLVSIFEANSELVLLFDDRFLALVVELIEEVLCVFWK